MVAVKSNEPPHPITARNDRRRNTQRTSFGHRAVTPSRHFDGPPHPNGLLQLDTSTRLWQSVIIDDWLHLRTHPMPDSSTDRRLLRAINAFDCVNSLDPRQQRFQGHDQPRELVFSERVAHWLLRLAPDASEAVRLAAAGHTLRRWEIPRDRYPHDTAGYHAWRDATAAHSARAAEALLRPIGYSDDLIQRVGRLVRCEDFPRDPDAQLLEDADCLAFLELKLADYLHQWDEEKLTRILHGTWTKMSEQARALVKLTPLDPRVKLLLERLP